MKLSLLFVLVLYMIGCVPQNTGRIIASDASTTDSTTDTGTTTSDPDFSNSTNYFQYGQTQVTGTLNIQKDYSDTLYLRGEQIHNYVVTHTTTINCLVAVFPTVTATQGNSIVVFAARPNSFYNIQTSKREYYYLIAPNDLETNQTYCQRPDLINLLNQNYPGQTIALKLDQLAQNTLSINVPSNAVQLASQYGLSITGISLTNLNMNVTYEATSQPPISQTCESSTECQSSGYDCCASGQCINDGELKEGVDTSSTEYIQALLDIAENESHRLNYPQFFNFCPTVVAPDPTPVPTPDPSNEPDVRLAGIKDLYDCTNPIDGEMSVCTKTIENVTNDNLANYLPLATGSNDLTFSQFYFGTNPSQIMNHSIYQVIYGDKIIYDANDSSTYANILMGAENYNFIDVTQFSLSLGSLPVSGTTNTLRIRYTTDGSCLPVSTDLVKCTKSYIQGQNDGKVTDHNGNTNNATVFNIPFYADISKYIQVKVDNITKVKGSDWSLNTGDKSIVFTNPVEDTEKVDIVYYVNTQLYPVYEDKLAAYEQIQTICNCVGEGCGLTPSYSDAGVLQDYLCYYPPVDTIAPPMQTEVQVSSKAVPVRFFNQDGEEITSVTTQSGLQEGNKFEYINADKLKPNNLDNYVGFNEIYGNSSYVAGSATAPTVVDVTKGRSYDIFTESGSYSSCTTCGSDYYSQLVKLFPDNFLYRGGGYFPDMSETSRISTTSYRSDDLHFGRACFLPAAMIPWSHHPSYDRSVQRKQRMATQHFMFANGYQRDWYGFDYGAIIGSFDGVAWFAIGNQRRIKATSNKLYIAVNSYFGDLTQSSSFKVSVTDTSLSYGGGTEISSDYYNDGAQCQQYHTCETDRDCVAQLGWEYTCQSVTQLRTQWPKFDDNGKEIINASEDKRLVDVIVGGFAGPAKRCVYRSRGVPCSKNYNTVSVDNSFAKTATPGLNACMQNNYCEDISDAGKFNNKIARFGRSPAYQNASTTLTIDQADTVGLEARVLGHPFDFNGNDSVETDAQGGLNYNYVTSLCIPGHDPGQSNFITANQTQPSNESYSGDRIGGIGQTSYEQNTTNNTYYAHCSILDDDGNYVFLTQPTVATTSDDIAALAASQSLSTNALKIFENIDSSLHILADFKLNVISETKLDYNGCLRAPGSVCHTDMDCGPSPFVTQKLANIDPLTDTGLNRAEKNFWKETLVCSQAEIPGSTDYDLKNNRCCRESGKNLTIPTLNSVSETFSSEIPGYGISISSNNRLSRFMMLTNKRFHDVNGSLTESKYYPKLQSAVDDQCGVGGTTCMDVAFLLNQFNSINTVATNTCCTGHWIREFDKTENNGGHKWSPERLQSFNYEGLKCLNWGDFDALGQLTTFECDPEGAPDFTNCPARNISLTEADGYFNFFGTLELLGIPQVAIKSTDFAEARCVVSETQTTSTTDVINYTTRTKLTAVQEYSSNPADAGSEKYFSSTDMSNFSTTLKKVFSEDDIVCCQPTGKQMPADTLPTECCTGNLVDGRCCLDDYTDVSVYLNRYVSSAAKGLSETMFDEETGYITDPNVVEQVAYQEGLCCSGSVTRGKVLNILKVPGLEDQNYTVRRFLDGTTPAEKSSKAIKDYWDAGVRWNNHVYCAPSGN